MKALKFTAICILFLILTAVTQVGGIIYLLSFFTYKFIDAKTNKPALRRLFRLFIFIILYLAVTFTIVPLLAKPLGRVRLPLRETGSLRPLNIMTCLLNRNYVRPELKIAAVEIAKELNEKFPGTVVNYLDGNFPFINKFPLLPHLSHNDGKKLDLAFCYRDSQTNKAINNCPSFIGYGICEEPAANEVNTAEFCSEKGYPQYSFLKMLIPQGAKKDFVFDAARTKALAELCYENRSVGKLFIEPHLKTRLGLASPKVRFHGCQAVRHDDHIHIQLN